MLEKELGGGRVLWLVVWRNREYSVHETQENALRYILFCYLQGATWHPVA